MERRVYRFLLIFIFIFCLVLIGFENFNVITGNTVSTFSAASNVTVLKLIAVSFSSDLTDGIVFESVHVLPAENISAVNNYNGTGNSSEYYLLVSSDGNIDVDLCIMADKALETIGADVIGLANETYSTSIGSDINNPDLVNETPLNLTYTKALNGIPRGQNGYVRFWLDIPAGQATGTYYNSIYFKAIGSGLGC
ncbi:MAG: hypothetical protein PF542_04030 [Nanoarchaeota archaeon]|jgi:hypothetical protein|nr:hypothetical protein [Nanoarchaeota archaeon]